MLHEQLFINNYNLFKLINWPLMPKIRMQTIHYEDFNINIIKIKCH